MDTVRHIGHSTVIKMHNQISREKAVNKLHSSKKLAYDFKSAYIDSLSSIPQLYKQVAGLPLG